MYIKHGITFSEFSVPTNINAHDTELQIVRIHTNKQMTVSMYLETNILPLHTDLKLFTYHKTEMIRSLAPIPLSYTQTKETKCIQ